ncbi:hypothetical protein GCM10028819_09950 [Spirosoma humi]
MQPYGYFLFLVFASGWAASQPVRETPQQSLNRYVTFLNQSADELTGRFQMLQGYYAAAYAVTNKSHQVAPLQLRLPSSGPLNDYGYRQALASDGLTPAEKQRLTVTTESLWRCLTKLDQTAKALETYVRLNDYQRDNLRQSDVLIGQMQSLFVQFGKERATLINQLRRIYRRYQPLLTTDVYLATEEGMDRILHSQQQLLDTLTFYLRTSDPSDWPVERVQQSLLADAKMLDSFDNNPLGIAYPTSGMISQFSVALKSIQQLKRDAVDGYTVAARQSPEHGNAFYRALLMHYNQDLLAARDGFVNYSVSIKRLLHSPKLIPAFSLARPTPSAQNSGQTPAFQDMAPVAFTIKPATSPASKTTVQVLSDYVGFINESLRQMHRIQLLIRNYQPIAERYRNPADAAKRAPLTYTYKEVILPVSAYQLLHTTSRSIPLPYRTSVTGQLEVLFSMLTEMDGLSTELVRYTTEKQYLQDQLHRSDAILDRYADLFELFDQKKERLYTDVRRIYESYPPASRTSAWYVSGRALLETIDRNREAIFGVKRYLRTQTDHLPAMDSVRAHARTLIADEYANLNGLKRYGRSNGLCPYSPYEDVAENSLRFEKVVAAVKPVTSSTNPFESAYYFYNNELIHQYNKFSELAPADVLPTINQPDLFVFRRQPPIDSVEPVVQPVESTVQLSRTASLAGYAPNNMVLLLDVSSSMSSPDKLPLLKQSIKSLLTLLRPEDQVSIVVYSGKARVALKPTSGTNSSDISRVIDELKSDGDTDGNKGIQLAYKTANKNYIEAGNNRIVLATDGEFDISDEVQASVAKNTQRAIFLTVFTFGKAEVNGRNLQKIARSGQGNYIHITPANAAQQLILEAQATKIP